MLSHVQLFVIPWTAAYQVPLSMGFSRQESWSGLPFLSPGDLPNPETEPGSPDCRQTLYCLSHSVGASFSRSTMKKRSFLIVREKIKAKLLL